MLHYFHYINLVTKHTHHLFPVQNHFVIYNKLQNLVMSQTVYLRKLSQLPNNEANNIVYKDTLIFITLFF